LDARERRKLLLVFLSMVGSALLEVAGIASIMPFLALVGNPNLVEENATLHWVYTTLGFHSVNRFLALVGFGVLVVLVVSNAFMAFSNWAVLRFTWMRNYTLSRKLLAAYLYRPYSYFLTRNTSTMARNILGEVQQVIQGVLVPFLQILSRGLVVVFIAALLVAVNPTIALILMGSLGAIYCTMYFAVRRYVTRLGRDRLEANRYRFRFAAEAFGGLKTVKLRRAEDHFVGRYAAHAFRFADKTSRNAVVSAIPRYAMETLAFGGILVVTLYLLSTGQSLGQMLPMLGLYAFGGYRLLPSLQSLFSNAADIRFSTASLEAVEADLLEGQRLADERATLRKNVDPIVLRKALELRGVSYSYPGTSAPAVRNVDLTVPAGASVALVGRTGSGKTTIADLVLGLLEPSEGRLLVDGVEISGTDLPRWQQSLGYIPQDIYLYDDTVTRNIALGVPDAEIDMAAVERAARIANIHDFVVSELPQGYGTAIGERGLRLSGGERQRIGIARALYHDPSMLILDEATSALDGATEESVFDALRSAARARTSLIIAHRLTTVRDCDEICVVEDGRIIARGTYNLLIQSCPQFQEMAKGMA
jgi:ABC-type multidrug transport system fused ATPase/permease subunit